jgi:tetratricopeptide (TPR) repeat protein
LVDVRASQQDAGPEATDAAYSEAFRAADLDIDALEAQGRLPDAEVEYRAALKLNPDAASVHDNLGDALHAQGKHAEAEFRTGFKLNPDDAQHHFNFAEALLKQNRLAEAETELRRAVTLKPDLAEAHCRLGQLLQRAGPYGEALEELRRGHELGARQAGWSYPSAQWVRDCERMAALAARLPAVLKGDDTPADAAERITLGKLCYDRKLHAAATKFYAEAFQSDPKMIEDREAAHAYDAACSAAIAGCG